MADHRTFGPTLAAQQSGQAIAVGRDQLGRSSLDDLPLPDTSFDGQRIRPAQQTDVRHAFQRARIEVDHQRIAQIKARDWPRKEIRCQDAHARPGAKGCQ